MQIFIPSLNRAEQVNHTFNNLPSSLQAVTKFVVGKEDASAYRLRFGAAHVEVVRAEGIGPVRQAIINMGKRGRVVMLDDDLSFFVRRKDDPTKLLKASPADVRMAFTLIERALGRYAHVGMAAREGANRDTSEYLYTTRMLRVLAYDTAVMAEERIRFDRCPVMEDFDVTLQLIKKGYRNCVINSHIQDQGTSNAPGGCSTYRTRELQAAGAERLHALHPDVVTVVQKETKGAWGGGVRTDVRIAWKKALP